MTSQICLPQVSTDSEGLLLSFFDVSCGVIFGEKNYQHEVTRGYVDAV